MNATHVIMAAPVFSAGLALSFIGFYRHAILKPIYLYWALFAAGIVCFLLVQADRAGMPLGPVSTIADIVGVPACGMSWLLSRALFRRDAATLWPLGVVAALFLTGIMIVLARMAGPGSDNAVMNMVMTVHNLTGSTVLLLALVEPVEGFRRSLPRPEKLFRLMFIFGYGALVAISVIWEREALAAAGVDGDEALSFVRVVCALIALALATAAVIWRAGHPMPQTVADKPARTITGDDRALAERIREAILARALHSDPEVKVADLAGAVGEPEYKVTRAITGALGYANFNRLINSYRIDHAKRLLADPACAEWSVLSIAMECGFGSIGPFNRAFKQATGSTPGAWREAQLASGIAVARSASR